MWKVIGIMAETDQICFELLIKYFLSLTLLIMIYISCFLSEYYPFKCFTFQIHIFSNMSHLQIYFKYVSNTCVYFKHVTDICIYMYISIYVWLMVLGRDILFVCHNLIYNMVCELRRTTNF